MRAAANSDLELLLMASFSSEKRTRAAAVLPAFRLIFCLLLLAALAGLAAFGSEALAADPARRRGGSSAAYFRSLYRAMAPPGPPDAASSSSSAAAAAAAAATASSPLLPWGTRADPDPLHLVFTLCGNPNEIEKDHYGLLAVKSILMAKEHAAGSLRHYHFHIITNVGDEELFNVTYLNWEVYRALQREAREGLVSFRTYNIRDLDVATRAALHGADPNLAVPHHIFKNCAATRIKLPFLLAGAVQRVLYLDWDTVVTCDLTRLWDHWARFAPHQLLGFASADPSGASDRDVYRMWNMPRHPALGAINSGVMLMDIGKMAADGGARALAFWHGISAIIRSKVNVTGTPQDYWDLTRAFVLGDQDILNALFAAPSANASWGHPEWLYLIPPEYNWCINPPFVQDILELGHTPLPSYKRRPAPCVHHFCGNRLMSNERGKEYLDVTDPTQGLFMYIKHWELERHEAPPGQRRAPDGNDPSTW